jgi:hypothetical protein
MPTFGRYPSRSIMAATISKVQLSTFFHTRRKLQTLDARKSAVTPCFD